MFENKQATTALFTSTVAFGVCFAAWMIYGVLIPYLITSQTFRFDESQMGWLIGLPVLTGSVARLPVGILTDKYGGRIVMPVLMILGAIAMFCTSMANSYGQFIIAGLGFGLCGASFAVGVAYVSVWFPPEKTGTALGIFGAGNAGAAVTSIVGPSLLLRLTDYGADPEGWRTFPRVYAAALLGAAIMFWICTTTRRADHSRTLSLTQRLAPLRSMRVWRFGLYYFLVFGGFVALAQWLVPYYVNAYGLSVAMAGILAACFSLPSGLIRALGGWMSDRWGARTVMYWVFGVIAAACGLMIVPPMNILSPGQGIMARGDGVVTSVTDEEIRVGETIYKLRQRTGPDFATLDANSILLPRLATWQEPAVKRGDEIRKKQLVARGVTNIFYSANVWVFTAVVFIIGVATGIGKAAVYKHIPSYFPDAVGVTGGMVGVLGGLGGVVCPIIFGYLLRTTGLWTSCWFFLGALTLICLLWMHIVVSRMDGKWKQSMGRVLRVPEPEARRK